MIRPSCEALLLAEVSVSAVVYATLIHPCVSMAGIFVQQGAAPAGLIKFQNIPRRTQVAPCRAPLPLGMPVLTDECPSKGD